MIAFVCGLWLNLSTIACDQLEVYVTDRGGTHGCGVVAC